MRLRDLMERVKLDVNAQSNYSPSCLSNFPHSVAQSMPLWVSMASHHPDQVLLWLHSLWPCRTSTTFRLLIQALPTLSRILNTCPKHTNQKAINSSISRHGAVFYNNLMIFDWSGLRDHKHFILKQISDPLKYCNTAIPIPLPIGLPFMPCDLPNQYELSSTDETYTQQGDIYLTFEESVSLLHRIMMPASHRPWEIVGKDYYQHTPYEGIRESNCCLSQQDRPTVHVKYQEKYVGKIVQKTVLNCCCYTQIYQEFEIYDHTGSLIYKVISRNPQRGHMLILPWWGFDKIVYQIHRASGEEQSTNIGMQENIGLAEGKVAGQIVHLFNGFAEYTSKNDKYGITFPNDSSEEEKCLILYCVLLIDYLLFCNF